MKSIVLILSALLTFASWVEAKTVVPFPIYNGTACPDTNFEPNPGVGGTIDFPSEDKDYEANLNCLIKVSFPEGYIINFTFSQFDFEKYENVGNENECDGNYDWLKFIDGNDVSDKTIAFCRDGTKALNRTFTSETNDITLWMYSDDAASGKGFKLNWTAVKVEPEPVDCECNLIGTAEKTCESETEKCKCKPNYTGEKCEKPACECNEIGTEEKTCEKETGQCKCKPNYTGEKCEKPACECNLIGTEEKTCEKETGKCKCKPNYNGDMCEECKEDFWISSAANGECKKCETCDEKCEENQTGSCDKSNGKCKCSSAATFAFDKTVVLFTAFLIFLSHQN